MKELEIWCRVKASSPCNRIGQAWGQLILPAIDPIGCLPYELAGLLPNREHNRDLMASIDHLPENRLGSQCVIGVFAADPFLNCKRIADHLIAKGYHQVANIPPVAAYGHDFLATLDKVASGRVIEQNNLDRLAQRGLSISPAVATMDCLVPAMDPFPSRLWIVPSFDMWHQGALLTEKLLELCHTVTRKTDVPAILSVGSSGITEQEALGAGAKGLLVDDCPTRAVG